MTEAEWKQRCVTRILKGVKKAGRIGIRDLKRATNYNRGPDHGPPLWYEALELLEKSKRVVCELDDYGNQLFAMTPEAARALGCDSRGRRTIFVTY